MSFAWGHGTPLRVARWLVPGIGRWGGGLLLSLVTLSLLWFSLMVECGERVGSALLLSPCVLLRHIMGSSGARALLIWFQACQARAGEQGVSAPFSLAHRYQWRMMTRVGSVLGSRSRGRVCGLMEGATLSLVPRGVLRALSPLPSPERSSRWRFSLTIGRSLLRHSGYGWVARARVHAHVLVLRAPSACVPLRHRACVL